MPKLFLTTALLLLTALARAANPVTVLQPSESHYKLTGRGTLQAERTIVLSRENNHYILTSIIEAQGLASLTGYGPVIETSRFAMASGHIQPLSYSNVDQSGMSGLNESIEFDWTNRVARSKREANSFELPLNEAILDPLTVIFSARLDLVNGVREPTYRVHEVNQIRTYRIFRLPVETIKVAENQFVCIHLVVDTERPKRKMHYWMVPELAYLPIQSKQFRDGRLEFVATLIGSSLLP